MKIKVNGKDEFAAEGISLGDFLKSKDLDPRAVVVELNLGVIPKEDYTHCVLKECDCLEIVRFVGGG